jgi:hypothetical protein
MLTKGASGLTSFVAVLQIEKNLLKLLESLPRMLPVPAIRDEIQTDRSMWRSDGDVRTGKGSSRAKLATPITKY